LGSVTDTLTPNGRAVTHTEYGPYGELVKSQGRAEYRADFGYAGMQYHAASGMYLTLFRAYDPGTGRWVSRDPIGEDGGINLYAYVGGNPASLADQLGLDPKGRDPTPKRIPSDNQNVINWLCRFGGMESPTEDLTAARKAGLDRNDDNLAAAERFAEMMDGNYSFYAPWRSDDLNFGQFLLKIIRDVAKNGAGNGSKDAGHVAKWGALGALNYEQGVIWNDWKRRNCNCEK
ncbi:RHS repeat-associated core domain-containing protein, partial [Ralstonia pseudosolanacearum]